MGILVYKRRRLAVSYRFLLVYLIGKFFIDVVMLYYASSGENNIWLYNSLLPLRYILLSQVFAHFFESKKIRRWINFSIPFFLVFSLFDVYFSNISSSSMDDHLSVRYGGIVECLLMLLWILLYFYELFKSLRIANLLKSPPFLIAVAWLLFYASLVFFSPLFYYTHRVGSTLRLGFLEYIPDFMDVVVVVIISVAVSMISKDTHD